MKQIIIICLLAAFTIIGFYVNREYWVGLFIKPIEKTEIQEGDVYGYETLDNLPSGSNNVAIGMSHANDTTTGSPCAGVGKAYKLIKK